MSTTLTKKIKEVAAKKISIEGEPNDKVCHYWLPTKNCVTCIGHFEEGLIQWGKNSNLIWEFYPGTILTTLLMTCNVAGKSQEELTFSNQMFNINSTSAENASDNYS